MLFIQICSKLYNCSSVSLTLGRIERINSTRAGSFATEVYDSGEGGNVALWGEERDIFGELVARGQAACGVARKVVIAFVAGK